MIRHVPATRCCRSSPSLRHHAGGLHRLVRPGRPRPGVRPDPGSAGSVIQGDQEPGLPADPGLHPGHSALCILDQPHRGHSSCLRRPSIDYGRWWRRLRIRRPALSIFTGQVALVTGLVARARLGDGAGVPAAGRRYRSRRPRRKRSEIPARDVAGARAERGILAFDVSDAPASAAAIHDIAARHAGSAIPVNNAATTLRQARPGQTDDDGPASSRQIDLTSGFRLRGKPAASWPRPLWPDRLHLVINGMIVRARHGGLRDGRDGLFRSRAGAAVELAPRASRSTRCAWLLPDGRQRRHARRSTRFHDRIAARIPGPGAWGQPDELCGAALYLVSRSAAFHDGSNPHGGRGNDRGDLIAVRWP